MLREIERVRGFVIFEVTSTSKKATTIIGYRVFPIKGLGDTKNSSPDFLDLGMAKEYIPWFKEIDHIGTVGIYKTLRPMYYICAPRGASEDDLAMVREKHYDLTNVRRAAALANSRMAA